MSAQNWKNNELDKDILVRGNKIYSPETCIFTSKNINTLLNNCTKKQGYIIGVHWDKDLQKFKASCNERGKLKHLGVFLIEENAQVVYNTFKQKLILTLAIEQHNKELKQALIRIA